MKNIYFLLLLSTGFISMTFTTNGQTFNLVKDIYPGVTGSTPGNLININGTLFFSAADSSHGYELWKSDGTAAGTVLIKVIGGPSGTLSNLSMFTNVNGTLFFEASFRTGGLLHGINHYKLWKSNGTSDGTIMIYPATSGSYARSLDILGNVNGMLYFTANDSTYGLRFYKSDGTVAGTVLQGADCTTNTEPLININGTYFFSADGNGGEQLWKSDGTAAGTVQVKNICPWAYPDNLANINGTLYFTADDSTHGRELWKSDGTAAGTVLIKDIYPGIDPGNVKNFLYVNGTLYFNATDPVHGAELWKSDGTSAGTVLVKDVDPRGFGDPIMGSDINGMLYFTATDSAHGRELWKSDGTAAGTVLVKDIYPGYLDSYPNSLININGSLCFFANDLIHGWELWKSDGTAAGTVLVKDIYPGGSGSNPSNLAIINATLYFNATDSIHGTELWKSDGSSAGTVLVKDFEAGTGSGNPGNITMVNGNVFLTATTAQYGTELYVGTTPTTALKEIANPSTAAINCFGGTAPVTVSATGGKAPYTGTGAKTVSAGRGTVLVAPITPATGKYTSVYYTIGGVSSSKNYVLKFSTLRSAGTATLRASIRQTHTPWTVITAKQAVTIGTSRIDHSFLFTAPPTQDTASFYIEIEQTAGNTWIDNIAFFEATSTGQLIGNNRYAYGQFEKDIKNIFVYSSPVNHTAVWDSTGKISSTYYYTVTDADGNTSVAEVKTSQPAAALKATATAGKITTAGGTTTITIAATGGTAPYTGTGNFTKGVGTYSYTVTDAKGCTATVSITLAVTAARESNPISILNKPLQLTAFPNPATAIISLIVAGGTNEKLSVQVNNAAGKIVYETTGNTNTTYTFGNHFTPGVYAVKVIQGNAVQTLKIIKTK